MVFSTSWEYSLYVVASSPIENLKRKEGVVMARSEAQRRATKKWNDKHLHERYDRIQLVVPKGKKEIIKAKADEQGESVNAFINRAIDLLMDD